jgi:hypothetical protein
LLSAQFRFASATEFTLHLEFHCETNCGHDWGTCDYAEDLRGENGVLKNAFPGLPFSCSQSAIDGFAVACSSLIGSDVQTVVKAQAVSHLVRFQVPFTFTQGIPDLPPGTPASGCLPFVSYEPAADLTSRKFINNRYFEFAKQDCRFDR